MTSRASGKPKEGKRDEYKTAKTDPGISPKYTVI